LYKALGGAPLPKDDLIPTADAASAQQ